jgi:hypothetical protein
MGKLLMQWISPYSVKDSSKVFRNVIILQSNLEESHSEKLTFSKIYVKFFGPNLLIGYFFKDLNQI